MSAATPGTPTKKKATGGSPRRHKRCTGGSLKLEPVSEQLNVAQNFANVSHYVRVRRSTVGSGTALAVSINCASDGFE